MLYWWGKIHKGTQNGLPSFCSLLAASGTLIKASTVFSEIFNTFDS